jgi:hypothetical protein
MQAVARSAVGEIARGLSAGLVVLAGNNCPACSCEPSLVCAACPDCACYGSERVHPGPGPSVGAAGVAIVIVSIFVVFFAGVHFGRAQPIIHKDTTVIKGGKKGLGGGIWLTNGGSRDGSPWSPGSGT